MLCEIWYACHPILEVGGKKLARYPANGTSAPSAYSDQPVQSLRLIRVYNGRSMGSKGSTIYSVAKLRLAHTGLASFLWDISKQCKTRSDAAKHGIRSGSSLFAYRSFYQILKKKYKKYHPKSLKLDNPFGLNGLIRLHGCANIVEPKLYTHVCLCLMFGTGSLIIPFG